MKKLGALLLVSPPVLLIALFVGLPVINAVGFALGYTGGLNTTLGRIGLGTHATTTWMPTTAAFSEVLSNPRFQSDLTATLGITAVVTFIVIVLAWALALYLRLYPSRLSRALPTLAVVPMFIPGVIGAWAMVKFWAADGFVGSLFIAVGLTPPQVAFSSTLVVIAQVWASLPFAVLMITSGVAGVPDALVEAARDAGASTWTVVKDVIVPMCIIPTVIAATFTAIGLIGSFTVPYFTGPNTPTMLGVSMTRYFQAYGKPQQSVVMAIIVFALAAVIGAAYVWANARAARETDVI